MKRMSASLELNLKSTERKDIGSLVCCQVSPEHTYSLWMFKL